MDKDGRLYTTGAGVAIQFTPDDQGIYVVRLTARDEDGGEASFQSTMNVTNVAHAKYRRTDDGARRALGQLDGECLRSWG